MRQVTKKQLENQVYLLNKVTNSPLSPYSPNGDGTHHHNPGNYHLSGAYGGWQLCRMADGGGANDITSGHIPKRELSELIDIYTRGILQGVEDSQAATV